MALLPRFPVEYARTWLGPTLVAAALVAPGGAYAGEEPLRSAPSTESIVVAESGEEFHLIRTELEPDRPCPSAEAKGTAVACVRQHISEREIAQLSAHLPPAEAAVAPDQAIPVRGPRRPQACAVAKANYQLGIAAFVYDRHVGCAYALHAVTLWKRINDGPWFVVGTAVIDAYEWNRLRVNSRTWVNNLELEPVSLTGEARAGLMVQEILLGPKSTTCFDYPGGIDAFCTARTHLFGGYLGRAPILMGVNVKTGMTWESRGSALGEHKPSSGIDYFHPGFPYTDPGPPGFKMPEPSFIRCDSRAEFTSPGCVYHLRRPVMELRLGSNHDEVARHILDAWPRLQEIGHEGTGGQALHRITPHYNFALWKQGQRRDKLEVACPKATRPDPTAQCDEYPMASTYEGAAATAPGTFSARWVSRRANASAGGVYGAFLYRERVLDGFYPGIPVPYLDPFMIRIPAAGSSATSLPSLTSDDPIETSYGFPDLDAYCFDRGDDYGAVLLGPTAADWHCTRGADVATRIDLTQACTQLFPPGAFVARYRDLNDPDSIECWRQEPLPTTPSLTNYGGVDFNAYCRSRGYESAVLLGPTPEDWACRSGSTTQPRLGVVEVADACDLAHGYREYVPAYQSPNDPQSWQCWAEGTPFPYPPERSVAVTNAASFRRTVAPDSIVAAFGPALATTTAAAPAGQTLPTTLGGTTVRLRNAANNEVLAPLLFVSPQQVNFLVPATTFPDTSQVTVTRGDGVKSGGIVSVARFAPGLFTADGSGAGVASAQVLRVRGGGLTYEAVARFDGTRWVPVPIDFGPPTDSIYLILYATGVRNRLSLEGVNATIGGERVPVLFSGAQGFFAGLDQVNVGPLPRTLAGGEREVVVREGANASAAVKVTFR